MKSYLQSIVTADIQSSLSKLLALENTVNQLGNDSGWINFTLENRTKEFSVDTKLGVGK
ncbi:hypothetical protein [Peribacillus sp. NPDC096540]|uniref:hypothetical protein n=1 Tax=Peribacillus sp. NPDC096540 TaxID=3390612 RepID=UPI003CFC4818